jgi:FAD/FMN-containing dehydrogenase/Fe-S oxidoreductase
MEHEPQRIEEDLRGIVSGEVCCDEVTRSLYATDASLFERMPLAVVRPRTAADVSATVRWAAENELTIHPRGGGTNLVGSAIGPGIVVDTSRLMRRVVAFDDAGATVRVQPGVVAAELDQRLASRGRMLGPDPATISVTTIGGMIGRDLSGSRFLRHGSIRQRVLAMDVVLADGSLVTLKPTLPSGLPRCLPPPGEPTDDLRPTPATLAAAVGGLLARHAEVIAREQPFTRRLHGGYRLHDLRRDGMIDLARLMCGSEGTLGVITEITLQTLPRDHATAVALVFFDSLEKAAVTVPQLLADGPSCCDLLDRRHLTLARTSEVAFDLIIPRWADGCLLVEFAADTRREARRQLAAAMEKLQLTPGLNVAIHRAEDDDDTRLAWRLSRNVVSTLQGSRGSTPAVPFIEDVVVPPKRLPEFLAGFQAAMKRTSVTAMLFGHAGHGELHIRPFVDVQNADERARLESFADEVAGHVASLGGTIGGEQGLGLSRTAVFGRLFPELAAVFAELKSCLDPAGTLNPGIIVGATAQPLARHARTPMQLEVLEPQLQWGAGAVVEEVEACNGCGGCRSRDSATRMCPLFREQPSEEASPRAKASLLARVLGGELPASAMESDAARAVADQCFNCHQCRVDCPTSVDIPALVTEIKAAHVATNGLGWGRWLRARVDLLSAVGGAMRPLANAALAGTQTRWLMEKTLGIARGRKLPPFAGNQLLRWAARRGYTRPSRHGWPRVMIFLDTFARRHDPLLTKALVRVLEHNGIGVWIDPRQVSAGMPLVTEGDLVAARRLARRNVRVLAEAVRQGYRIISTEPAAVTCLKHDYPLLLDDDEVGRIADATTDATTFLWELHREGRLRLDFQPISARLLYHTPCHVRARSGTSPAEHLLRLIPGLFVDAEDRGCSGMAGTFGLARDHYRTSLRAGYKLATAMREARVAAGVTECSACRLQMEQGTTKPTVHPIKLLAMSYGSVEGLEGMLSATSGHLVTS